MGILINLFKDIFKFVCFINVVISLLINWKLWFCLSIIIDIGINIINRIILGLLMNFSLDAILVIYINRISIPPTRIRNRIYENQKFEFIFPVISLIRIVCNSKISPIDRGWFIIVNIIVIVMLNDNSVIISRSSLIKILILEISDKFRIFSWCF